MTRRLDGVMLVDVRGLSCPQPVIQVRQAMAENRRIEALVSTTEQAENVIRMAERAGWQCERSGEGDHFVVRLTPGQATSTPVIEPEDLVCSPEAPVISVNPRVVVIESEYMGRGDDVLGKMLMKAFINTLKDCEKRPATLIFFNSGVKLTVEGSPVLESLKTLLEAGTTILVCGTCLDFFHLKDKLAVGVVSNMLDIAESMLGSGIVYIG